MYIYIVVLMYAETPSPLETIPGRILNHEPFCGFPAKRCGVSSQKYIQVVYDRSLIPKPQFASCENIRRVGSSCCRSSGNPGGVEKLEMGQK